MPFLTARWEHLVLLNYVCPAATLEPLVPAGTTLDAWEGDALVSLVGFLFSDTRVLRVPVPLHRTFEEVNLRFYVRGPAPDFRRAVVFIRELVPRWAIAAVARGIYNEPYLSVPMSHRWLLAKDRAEIGYGWTYGAAAFEVGARVSGAPAPYNRLVMCESLPAPLIARYSSPSSSTPSANRPLAPLLSITMIDPTISR